MTNCDTSLLPDGAAATESYPFLRRFSHLIGIPEENLLKAFEIERHYHKLILQEAAAEKRKLLYREMYNQVHPLYNKSNTAESGKNPFRRMVKLFKRELNGRSILDVGCGTGSFLKCVADTVPHGRLVGIDTSLSVLPKSKNSIQFIESDVIDFEVNNSFDVVFSHHVLEHIAPADVASHIGSIKKVLSPGGCLILCAPNRLFGPSDVTRILDYTNCNRTRAMGSHLNELSYTETITLLQKYGFSDFKTILPLRLLKYGFPNLRLDPSFLIHLENHPKLLNLLYLLRFRSRCLLAFDVVLVCRQRSDGEC